MVPVVGVCDVAGMRWQHALAALSLSAVNRQHQALRKRTPSPAGPLRSLRSKPYFVVASSGVFVREPNRIEHLPVCHPAAAQPATASTA